ncbi:Hypothetical_protein [Hexamita inflata]|uniref:Hypothetical_protein n=1 Tax=Hexamita inflata TaxID=28002 RepID=A0AA86R929_9EUKA|nr:Hypothetical protein HINF_LOCUS60620 [Hexamita inflata]
MKHFYETSQCFAYRQSKLQTYSPHHLNVILNSSNQLRVDTTIYHYSYGISLLFLKICYALLQKQQKCEKALRVYVLSATILCFYANFIYYSNKEQTLVTSWFKSDTYMDTWSVNKIYVILLIPQVCMSIYCIYSRPNEIFVFQLSETGAFSPTPRIKTNLYNNLEQGQNHANLFGCMLYSLIQAHDVQNCQDIIKQSRCCRYRKRWFQSIS